MKPKNLYILVYECGRVVPTVFYSEKSARHFAETFNYLDAKIVKYIPKV